MREGADFPSPQMSCEKHHAFTPRLSLSKILEALVDSNPANVFPGITREEAEFRQQPAQIDINAAQDLLLFFPAQCRKSQVQVALAHSTQSDMDPINQHAQADSESPCQTPRQSAYECRQNPEREIFKPVSHERRTQDGTIGKGIIQIRGNLGQFMPAKTQEGGRRSTAWGGCPTQFRSVTEIPPEGLTSFSFGS